MVARRVWSFEESGSRGSSEVPEMRTIQSHEDLVVYQMAFEAAMRIGERSKQFPREETYSLRGQMRRSSRSVRGNLAEA